MASVITPQQILDDRASRKASGLIGCITGRPVPALDFFGFRDVQIWNMDAQGRMNGDPNFNRRDPFCFCFDHRNAFDPSGEMDASLVNEHHPLARYTYRTLFPDEVIQNPHNPVPPALVIADPPHNDNDGVPPPGGEPGLANVGLGLGLANAVNLAPLAFAAPLPDDDDDDEDTQPIPQAQEILEPDDYNEHELEHMAYQDQYYDCQDDYDDGSGGMDWNESGYFD